MHLIFLASWKITSSKIDQVRKALFGINSTTPATSQFSYHPKRPFLGTGDY
jgi:hypothetical protein